MTREKNIHVGSWLSSYQRKTCVLDTFTPPSFMKVTLLSLCLLCLEICGKQILGCNRLAGVQNQNQIPWGILCKKPLWLSLFFKTVTIYSPGSVWWIVKLKWKRSGRDITSQTEPRFIFILLSLRRCDKTVLKENCLTHFTLMSYFYFWKGQKTKGFLTISSGIEMKHCAKMA